MTSLRPSQSTSAMHVHVTQSKSSESGNVTIFVKPSLIIFLLIKDTHSPRKLGRVSFRKDFRDRYEGRTCQLQADLSTFLLISIRVIKPIKDVAVHTN